MLVSPFAGDQPACQHLEMYLSPLYNLFQFVSPGFSLKEIETSELLKSEDFPASVKQGLSLLLDFLYLAILIFTFY